ncbi:MAG: hypothetical protein WBM46_04495 [Polyangiales bacterium]|jgi:hypothetical protein
MEHKAGMGEDSSAEPEAPTFGDRVRASIDQVQGWAHGVYQKVPRRLRQGLQRGFSITVLVVIGLLLYRQLRGTDWPAVLRSLPTSPWFYVLFLTRFITLPIIDTLCYSAVFATSLFRHFGTFLMKYILNMAVAGATGDVYFLFWAVRTLGIGYRRAFSAVKDVSLLSAAASNTVAVLVLGAYFALGDLSLTDSISRGAMITIIAVTLGTATLSVLFIAFRGKVFAVSTPVMWRIIAYHIIRSGGDLTLLGFQWTVGLPGTTFGDWINLLIVAVLVARAPGLPAKDFLFLSLALALGDTVDADSTKVKALFLTDTALRQIAFGVSFIAGSLWRSRPHPIPLDRSGDEDEDTEPAEHIG